MDGLGNTNVAKHILLQISRTVAAQSAQHWASIGRLGVTGNLYQPLGPANRRKDSQHKRGM
ncbi:uncharacterized protein N7500_005209 [Penicillium coprophilum]|uniref:uncharacterized protein n=1 Tax=Penicillium coprophilum TaxID=36646 RepID=UPI002389C0EA|nr:uncharacterized protein N7500_005209 [Penicillium coprophilum]KAJ5163379.1 hypothetical protein N7500_005209 [Penicillium coprophilum]